MARSIQQLQPPSPPGAPPDTVEPVREPLPASDEFPALFRAHASHVIGLLRRLGIREVDVQDVAQEVFVRVHQKLPGFEGRSSLRTWIIGIATRVAQNHRRLAHVRRERLQDAPETPTTGASGGPAAAYAQGEARAMLLAALDTLDEKQRDVFVLYDVEGLEMAEVVVALGCPRFTGYTRLRAARRAMRKELERRGYGRAHD